MTSTSAEGRLGIEVSVPAGWQRVQTAELPVAFVAPAELDYRTTIGFSNEEFDPPTREGLAAGMAMLRDRQAAEYDEFELLDEREAEIDGHYAYIEHYRWMAPTQPPMWLTQVLALIVVKPGLLIKVDGACLSQLASTYLPMLDEMVTSLRFSA